MQDILNADGNFLTFEEFQNKFQVKTNYLRYFQLMAAIPSDLYELLDTPMIFYSTSTASMDLTKMRCKHYYKILNESYCWRCMIDSQAYALAQLRQRAKSLWVEGG